MMDGDLARQAIGAAAAIFFLLAAAYVMIRRRRFGPVLVRLGRYGPHTLMLRVGLMGLGLGAFQLVALDRLNLIWWSVGAGSVLLGLLPLELRQHGIVSRDNAYRWSRVIQWRWLDPDRSQLELRVQSRWSNGITVIPIPSAQVDRVAEILSSRAGSAAFGRSS